MENYKQMKTLLFGFKAVWNILRMLWFYARSKRTSQTVRPWSSVDTIIDRETRSRTWYCWEINIPRLLGHIDLKYALKFQRQRWEQSNEKVECEIELKWRDTVTGKDHVVISGEYDKGRNAKEEI